MDALVVQSRFAGLKIEDDDFPPSSNQKAKKTKPANGKKVEPTKKSKCSGNKTQVQTTPAQKKRKTKACPVSDDQWEMWKQKDEELVDGHYENELQQALLLSKLDYEEKKDVYKQIKKEHAEKKSSETPRGNKKPKKKNVMSLDQFNEMVSGDDAKYDENAELPPDDQKPPEKETDFFDRVKDATKNIIFKDKMNDKVKNRLSMPDEVITRVKFADALEKKDKEIADLKDEINSLKKELMTVKCRNKKLCNILGQGEMKDKAEILVEVERLRTEQAELTAELAALHTDLEKERSKNADPRNVRDKKHPTKKKNIRFDVSTEALITKEASSGTA